MLVSGDDESMNASIEAKQRFELLYYGETDSYEHGSATFVGFPRMASNTRCATLEVLSAD